MAALRSYKQFIEARGARSPYVKLQKLRDLPGDLSDALSSFGPQVDSATYGVLLRQCGDEKNLAEGRRIHAHIAGGAYADDRFVLNFLVEMYGRCGSIEDARAAFDKIHNKNKFSWGLVISANVQNEEFREVVRLFRKMQLEGIQPDRHTLGTVLNAVTSLEDLEEGKRIQHGVLDSGLDSHIAIATGIVNMYSKCGNLREAKKLFDQMPRKDAIAWTAMIAGYAQHGHGTQALQVFREMDLDGVLPDIVTFVSAADACSSVGDVLVANFLHDEVVENELEMSIVLGTAIIDMYGKCRKVEEARSVFDEMKERNLVTWNAMIEAYSQAGDCKEAMKLRQRMDNEGMLPNCKTLSSLMEACAAAALSFSYGKKIHERVIAAGWDADVIVCSSLMNMYGRCGKLEEAREVFEKMSFRNVISWNAMIAAYAQNGHLAQALGLYVRSNLEGVMPDSVTLTVVMSACAHAGKIDDAREQFVSMQANYAVEPRIEHYGALIDLLGRGSKLDAAEDLIENMPFQPDALVWTTFLRACKSHGEIERGGRVAKAALVTFPKQDSLYVLLSNMYSEGELWNELEELRRLVEKPETEMKEKKKKKKREKEVLIGNGNVMLGCSMSGQLLGRLSKGKFSVSSETVTPLSYY